MHRRCQRSDGLLSKVRNADVKKHLTFSLGVLGIFLFPSSFPTSSPTLLLPDFFNNIYPGDILHYDFDLLFLDG